MKIKIPKLQISMKTNLHTICLLILHGATRVFYRMAVGFTTNYAFSTYHHYWRGVLDITVCDKVCQRLAPIRWVSPGTPVSSNNKTNCYDITEILLRVAFNTITLTPNIHNKTFNKNAF